MSGAFDPEILQDFLTESGELLDELEVDLVELESTPGDPELLNKAFRALHTIKGSASFLELTNLVAIAHAAETALNAARNGTLTVTREVMDLFLEAVDLVKVQMGEIASGSPLTEPDPRLVERLIDLGENGGSVGADTSAQPETPAGEPAAGSSAAETPGRTRPLVLPENKLDLLDFLLVDLEETAAKISDEVDRVADESTRRPAAAALAELGEMLERSAEFFEHDQLTEIARLFTACESLADANNDAIVQALPRIAALRLVMEAHIRPLGEQRILDIPLGELPDRLTRAIGGDALEGDGVVGAAAHPAEVAEADSFEIPGIAGPQGLLPADGGLPETGATPAVSPALAAPPEAAAPPAPPRETSKATSVEQTIRVEVGRLESLMNLVGELVLQKNRINALARRLDVEGKTDPGLLEDVNEGASGLDRVTGDMQVAVMRTRMQPLDKLFGKYPRLIRDLAKKTGKQITLQIEGGETEVDKSVIEELGDPLVHLLRNAADHGLEPPEERAAAGKAELGTIRIAATHEGSHVLVRIIDDGRGMDPEKIAAKAVEKGLVSESEVRTLDGKSKLRYILAPGFSTAQQVSDLSGRGVGMDVVKTNIEALKGTLELDSTLGGGTTVSISIPLTVAIMPAMMVRVGTEAYAIPLGNVVEIVRPEAVNFSTIRGRPVLNLRDSVLPMVDACDVFDLPHGSRRPSPFCVVLQQLGKQFALAVTAPIGQQEIVIKPLDHVLEKTGPVSGATVRDDGGVSLIIDVGELLRVGDAAGTLVGGGRPAARLEADDENASASQITPQSEASRADTENVPERPAAA
ncbi:MAG: chemotaxis protein CheA [Planctomycetota bacterium]